MGFKGEVKRVSFVSQNDPDVFYSEVIKQIQTYGNLHVEAQYQTTMEPTGRALFSVLLIGRLRENE